MSSKENITNKEKKTEYNVPATINKQHWNETYCTKKKHRQRNPQHQRQQRPHTPYLKTIPDGCEPTARHPRRPSRSTPVKAPLRPSSRETLRPTILTSWPQESLWRIYSNHVSPALTLGLNYPNLTYSNLSLDIPDGSALQTSGSCSNGPRRQEFGYIVPRPCLTTWFISGLILDLPSFCNFN